MRYLTLAPIVLLAACAEAPMEMEMAEMAAMPITDEASFLAMVADKRMVLEGTDNSVVVNSDGSIGGTFAGTDLAGSWEWIDGAWCRTLTAGPRGPSPEDCQVWTKVGDNAFSVTRDRGAGSSFVYVIDT